MNNKILFNDGWEFAKSSLDVTDSSVLDFMPVDLPHDWLIYNTLNLYEGSIGWYRKTFCPAEDTWQYLLYFEGVYMDSYLYVNGRLIGEWKYGYSSFEHDITHALRKGDNELLLKVIHQSPNSRWYSGAGIYRSVWLKTRARNHIVTDGIYVSAKETETKNLWKVEIDTEMLLREDARLTHTLLYDNRVIASGDSLVKAKDGSVTCELELMVESPLLWSPDTPHLYQLNTTLSIFTAEQKMELVEDLTQNTGFRTLLMDPDLGFMLNGTRMKLNGVCEHHDLGALGAAFNKVALRRRFQLLKDMGVNAVRTAHNMPAPELMDLADEMGLLVLSEAFDMWERPKTRYDYSRFFNEWAYADVKSWIMRDRNHPCLLLWSIGNEVYDTHAGERGLEIARMLMEYVHAFDPKENARVTFGSNYMPWENTQKCADLLKVAGYNYGDAYYHKHHKEYPDWIIYGSETASTVQSRGIYHFPFEKSILANDNEQCSSLGNCTTSWGAKSSEACILAERNAPFSMGQFIWTGFDYIGEPTPYHTKNSYFGQLDTATFKKDSYYIYQAAWTDYKKHPMVHILPYWDFNNGQLIDIRIFSNAPKVELQLNGAAIGTYDIDHAQGTQLAGWWKLPYEKGEIRAIAYDENGNIIATDIRRSFGDAKEIMLHADKRTMEADGLDLIFVEISMADADGNDVENANNRVFVKVSGAGRLIGLDNGDSTDYDSYKGLSRRLFNGKLMAIIASLAKPGSVLLEVSSAGMESKTLTLEALPCTDKLTGISAHMENKDYPIIMGHSDEIPLRKIELICRSERELNACKKDAEVHAVLHPDNASYTDLEWSIVNETGIPSTIAKVEPMGKKAILTAMGDGVFYLRCTSKNGTNKIKLMSQLEFTVTGLGTAYKDPYKFISSGLYDYSKGDLGNGNEKGVATGRDGETQVGFRDIDFGPIGSDLITLPIFALNDEKYFIQVWEGMPEEDGSEIIGEVIYQKKSTWNVYQEETYRLSKKLKGFSSICFVLNQKIHIKGFRFERINSAFALNYAAESNHIYGDTYTIAGNYVTGIGNNVSLEYHHMDFGAAGVSRLIIFGKSNIDKNTIHLRFSGDDGDSAQIIDVIQSGGYEEHIFELNKITGMNHVTFIFLPGCNFDFGWFRFEK